MGSRTLSPSEIPRDTADVLGLLVDSGDPAEHFQVGPVIPELRRRIRAVPNFFFVALILIRLLILFRKNAVAKYFLTIKKH